MSSRKLVTPRQAESVRQMANDKGVSREEFQVALDRGDIARFLDSLKVGEVKTPFWETWRTMKLGTFMDDVAIRSALIADGWIITDWAGDILDKVTMSVMNEEFELVNVSLVELGFKRKATCGSVHDRALKSGLELCSAEVGLQAALQFGGQLKDGEWFVVGMQAITNSCGHLSAFIIGRCDDGRLRLSANCGHPSYFWDVDCRFLFQRTKSW